MDGLRITHVGGPTVLLEVAGWRILTDPTFDPPGRTYEFGWGTSSHKVAGPALDPDALGDVDAVLITHDHHADNLDDAGRALLARVPRIVTTRSGARRLGAGAATEASGDELDGSSGADGSSDGPPGVDGRGGSPGRRRRRDWIVRFDGIVGVEPWGRTTLEAPGKPTIEITATPCRHGPPLSHPIVGDVIGFALAWEGQRDGVLWISGDTVLYEGVKEIPERLDVDVAILHLGGVRFPITGPLRYTMTAADGIKLCRSLHPRTIVPVHYEGWSHFRDGRAAIDAALASAPAAVRDAFRILPIGVATDLG